MRSVDLVVLGAGPAGLAAAWRAARTGLSTVVLERASAVGGMAASFDVAGVRVDHGSHRLHPATAPHVLADLRGLLGDDLQLRPRNGRLRLAGRWVSFPLRAGELLRALPPAMAARIALDAATGPLRRGEPTSYADALRRGLGPTVYGALYEPYAQKLWGLPGGAIDVEQARRRVTADTPWKVAARILRPDRSGQGHVFHYPRRGFGQLVEALAQAGADAGADIRLGGEVTRVAADAHGVTVGAADGTEVRAAQVFTTLPLPVLARVSTPAPDPAAVQAASALRFRSMLLVYLVHQDRPWTPFDAHYLPAGDTPVSRISEPTNYRDSADDPDGRTVLCAELPCTEGDAWWTASDAELADVVTRTLAANDLPPVRPDGVEVRRLRHVYPVYATGYAAHLQRLDAWAGALPRVTTFGRLGLFAHDNTHHAIAMAYDAVDALRFSEGGDGAVDPGAWAAARRRFADHVVED